MISERHFYHCASKGLEDNVLFASRVHFIAGMNRVGLCLLAINGVIIFAFVLMDNHVHFILYGTKEDCDRFMAQYKKLTCIYAANNTGRKVTDFEYDCWLIPNKEKLQEKICYVLRNPLAAWMPVLPTNYLWGSGPLMFAADPAANFHPLGETSEYYRRKVFGTKQVIPAEWLVNDEGMIWPGSYVEYKRAESMFDNVTSFLYGLTQNKEDMINQEMYGNTISLHDHVVIASLKKCAEEYFGNDNLDYLTLDQRLDLIRTLRRTKGWDAKQMGRLLNIKHRDLKRIF